MRSFDEWYERWTGSKVKCENYDVRGAWQHQQAKINELQKRVDESESKLLKLSEFIYGCGDFREYSRGELVGTQRTLKEILIGVSLPSGELEQALKGGNK